jgi:aspartyl-tRNA(Asn)/glutamyl-tRNA(Gln) amidotransferase subunit A
VHRTDRSSRQGKLPRRSGPPLKTTSATKTTRISAVPASSNLTSLYSATAVERLLPEGAIIIGPPECDEFGMGSTNEIHFLWPRPSTPTDLQRVPGGSSGGSAAAVKAGLCMAALGSDTGGSVRLPADFCGIVGLKPSYGRVSRHGLIAYASSFDVIGVLANSVTDATKLLEVIAGPDEWDSTVMRQQLDFQSSEESDKKYRIAYFPNGSTILHRSGDCRRYPGQIKRLKEAGHTVEPVTFALTDYIVPTYYILTTAEASSNLSRYDGVRYGQNWHEPNQELASFYQQNRKKGFGSEVKRRIMLGTFVLSSGYYDAYYQKAQQVRQLLLHQTTLIFNDLDFIIAPTAPSVAYKLGEKNKINWPCIWAISSPFLPI